MTALVDTLFQLEKQLGLELDSLLPYADADTLGGYHPEVEQRKWGSGAVWEVEGKTLYALVSVLRPQVIVEIGSGTGCSTNHMAQALKDQHIDGHITTVDRANTPHVIHELRDLVDVRNDDAINWLALQPDSSIDFLLEDADHSIPLCQAIGELAKTKLKPGGVLMAHDAAHFGVGADVKRGYDLAGLDFRVYLTDPSDCGWSVWQRPIEYISENVYGKVNRGIQKVGTITESGIVLNTAVLQAQEEPNADEPVTPTASGKLLITVDNGSSFTEVDTAEEPNADEWTPATLSDGQIEALNLDAKWQVENKADEPPVEKKVKRTRKAKAK